jgi:hypothetical protein
MMEGIRSSEISDLKEPHGVTSQKTPFFIVIAAKTSNLIKNGVFWDVTPRGFCKNRCFGGT